MDLTQKELLSPTMRGILAIERQEGEALGWEKGREAERQENNRKLIQRLLNKGFNDEQIMDIAEITMEQVQQYKANL